MSDHLQYSARTTGARHVPLLAAVAIALLMFAFGALRYPHFGSPATLTNILSDYAFVGIAAVGATFVILAGGIDLSVGSMVACSSILIAALVQHGWHPLAAAGLAMAAGAAAGAVMGAVVHGFGLPSFIVTLAGMFAVRAAGFMISDHSVAIRHDVYVWTSRSATMPLGGGAALTLRGMLLLAVVLAGVVLARRTVFGRHACAVGGSAASARLMGVNVGATTIGVFALSGFAGALAGFVHTLGQRAGDPAGVVGLELEVIAAVVIGGTLLSGGVGGVGGTLVGVVILGLIRAIMDFQGTLNAAWTSVATGMLLLMFVALQQVLAATLVRRAP